MIKRHIYKSASILTKLVSFILIFLVNIISVESFAQTKNTFAIKGFHIDLRTQVMTMDALKKTASELAEFGINTIVMEWEATYPYDKHVTISNKDAYSREEVKSFIKYCNNLNIDVIPLQQCFGHAEYILRHYRYGHLKEDDKEISQVCPLKLEGNKELFSDLFEDMVSMHNSKYLHIGGDETLLLGHCSKCKAKVEKEGVSKLYVDYIKEMCNIVINMGKIPVIWADMVITHPEALEELPDEVVLVDWNYGWEKDYFGNIDNIINSKLEIWGSPAIRSHPDNWFLAMWERHFNNQRDFIPFARQSGYKGIVMTSWSTSGLYGYSWDIGWDVIDFQPIRNVYPLSGYRIILASYAEALNSTNPIKPKEFVVDYVDKRFGFAKAQGEEFWNALMANPIEIIDAIPVDNSSLTSVKNDIEKAKNIMDRLEPSENKEEFEHFRLMVDIRLFYVNLKILEAKYNDEDFSRSQVKELLIAAKELKKNNDNLNIRFDQLNKGYLKESQIEEQNFIRNQRLKILIERLTAVK